MTDEYGYNFYKKLPIILPNNVLTKKCRRCGAAFETKSRSKLRCDACQHNVLVERGRIHDEGRVR
jgi:DNA-directed RNA polymerase subunit RPC12/RpoP